MPSREFATGGALPRTIFAPLMSEAERLAPEALAQAGASIEQINADARDGRSVEPSAGAAPAGESSKGVDGTSASGDPDLHVTIELGRAEVLVEDARGLREGSVIELD